MAISRNIIQPNNPTDEQRHEMLKNILDEVNRTEDFENIVSTLSPPEDIIKILQSGSCKGMNLGIIGAGIAGLAAAFELRKLGFNITIFEKQEKRIGGRIYTHYFDENERLYGEFGAMRIPISHETTWHYINTFGIKTNPFIQNYKNSFFYIRHRRARNDPKGKSVMGKIYPQFNLTEKEKNTPWQKLIEQGLTSDLYKLEPSIRKELIEIKKNYSEIIKYIGSLRIRDVLKKNGLSKGAIELISCISPFLGSFYNNSYLENLIEEYTVDFAYRYEISGGAEKLPLAFYNSLISKKPKEYSNIKESEIGKIIFKKGNEVKSIYKSELKEKITIEYKEGKTSKLFNETFDFIICAIPFSSLRNVNIYPMFTPKKMQAIKEVYYASAEKTLFLCNESFWQKGNVSERILGGGSNTDLSIQTIWYPNPIVDIDKKYNIDIFSKKNISNSAVLLASYNLNLDAIRVGGLLDNERLELIKRQVEDVHGLKRGYLDSVVREAKTVNWNTEPGFNGGFCYFMPGQQQLFSYEMGQPEYDNRVYFAGEHVSMIHGWIEGSVNTAMKVANNIARYLKKTKKLATL